MAERRDHFRNHRASTLLALSCIAAFAIANTTGWFAPQVVQGSMQRFGLSAAQAGLLPTAETLVSGVMSILFASWLKRVNVRLLGLAALLVWAGVNAASAYAPSFPVLLALRLVAGFANAALFFIATSLGASTPQPDRTYAFSNIASNLTSASALAVWPLIAPTANGLTYLPFAIIYAVLAFPLVLALPARSASDPVATAADATTGAHAPRRTGLVLLLSFALCLFTIQGFADFAFSFGFGLRTGLSEAEINKALGLATLASTLGALSAAFAAARFGRFWPQFAVFALFLASNHVEVTTTSASLFRASLIVNLTAMSFALPFSLSWAAEIDPSGRGSSLMIGIFIIANAVAPALAGKLVDLFSLNVLTPSNNVLLSCALLLLVIVWWRQRPSTAAAAAGS